MPATVLLVEDDALFRETVRDTLLSAGYHVLEAADGLLAIEQIKDHHPDLVLLDFDLPRMMGDEALNRMLQMRPGLICYVLSGKDDLHQALMMGRRGAYGWIDKYVGTDRLLALVAEGLRTRSTGADLMRLVTTCYPQPVAAPFIRWKRMDGNSTASQRLSALRELYEALVEYLGVTSLAVYLNRGLLDDELNGLFWQAIEHPSPLAWLAAFKMALARFEEQPHTAWWDGLAERLRRPAARPDLMADVLRVVSRQIPLPPGTNSHSLFDLFQSLARYRELWLTPERLLPSDAADAVRALEAGLEQAVAELSLLCDLQICWVEQASVTADGDYAVNLDVLAGLTLQNRNLTSPTPLKQGELYLVSRLTPEVVAPLAPLMIYDRCEIAGLVSHGVFTLSQIIPEQRAMYLSHTCGHLRWVDSTVTLEAARRLYFNLNPRGNRYEHLLRNIAVALIDLSGYTALTREQGPTVARELVRRMVSAVRDAALRHGGTVGEPVGDEVLAYFTSPDHAMQSTVESMSTLSALNARNPAATVHVHVGIDYGPGVVERNDVWGDVINRAKRCQSIAGPDEIVITADLKQALTDPDRWPLSCIESDLKGFGQSDVYKMIWRPDS